MLVGDLPDDLLKNVLERDKALHLAVFVDDERELRLALEELIELFLDAGRIRHEPGLAQQLGDVDALGCPAGSPQRREQILAVQDTDDVVGFVAPHRHPRILAREHRIDDLVRRVGDVDRRHLGAVNHDVENLQFAEIEHAAEHLGIVAGDRAFLGLQLDGAADLLVGEDIGVVVDAGWRKPQELAHDEFDGLGQRPHDLDEGPHGGAHRQRHVVRVRDRVGLRQDLGEDHDQRRDQHCRVGDADIAEQIDEQARGQGRREDVDEVVAEENRADHPLGCLHELVDHSSARIAFCSEGVHSGPRGNGEGGFRSREEGRDAKQEKNGRDSQDDFEGHLLSCGAIPRCCRVEMKRLVRQPIARPARGMAASDDCVTSACGERRL